MKKYIIIIFLLLIFVIYIITCFYLKKENKENSNNINVTYYNDIINNIGETNETIWHGKIIYIKEFYVKVKISEKNNEIYIFSISNITDIICKENRINKNELKKGDNILITFGGLITQADPPSIENVYRVELIK